MPLKEARNAVEAFLKAFNDMDEEGQRAAQHYPHITLFGVEMRTYSAPQDYKDLTPHWRKIEDWSYSTIDKMDPIHVSETKVHLDVTFRRYNSKGENYLTINGVWVIVQKEGRWGIQIRSMFRV